MFNPDPKSRPGTNKICSYFIGQTNIVIMLKSNSNLKKLKSSEKKIFKSDKWETKKESEQHEVENSTSNENDENNKNDQSVIHPQAIYTSRLISISNLSGCSDMAIW